MPDFDAKKPRSIARVYDYLMTANGPPAPRDGQVLVGVGRVPG
jgi:hypothetical protein